jgi:hypothetical protein
MDSTEALFRSPTVLDSAHKLLKLGRLEVVARDGIEPPTPAFSGLKSANVNLLQTNALGTFFIPKNGLEVQPIATIGSFRIAPTRPRLAIEV